MPAVQGPIEVVSTSQEPTTAQVFDTKPEPVQPSTAPQPVLAKAPQPQDVSPAEEPDPISAAFSKQKKNIQQGLLERKPSKSIQIRLMCQI